MYKFLLILIFIGVFGSGIEAQSNYKIDFEIENYDNDTLIIGYFYGKSQRVIDTLINTNKDGKFAFEGNDTLKQGVYIALLKPENSYMQFMVDDDQEFKIITDKNDLNYFKVKGSKENSIYVDYLKFLKKQNEKVDKINLDFMGTLSIQDSIAKDLAFKAINEEVLQKQRKIIDSDTTGLTSILINADMNIEFPKFEGTEDEIKLASYHFLKKHYFDNIALGNDNAFRMPGFDSKIKRYIEKLTPMHPDSIIRSIDMLLSKFEPKGEAYKFYLSTWLNTYGKSRIVGQDAIYVYLANNYYGKGKAYWSNEKTIKKIQKEAKLMESSLIGKMAPNVKFAKEDSTTINLYDIESEYTVLFFWSPTCGHCKKSMPDVVKFQEDYKNKGVKVVAICTKTGSDYKTCWESVKKENMETFLNLGDPGHRSRFKMLYNIRRTPKVFVLDEDKKILIKDIPANKVGEVLESIMKEQKELKD